MNSLTKGTAILGALLLSSSAFAQKLTVTPGNLLRLNQPATITYVNPALAGTTVVVTVTGGFPIPSTEEVQIKLDENGKGSATWTPTNGLWILATFAAASVADVTIPVG